MTALSKGYRPVVPPVPPKLFCRNYKNNVTAQQTLPDSLQASTPLANRQVATSPTPLGLTPLQQVPADKTQEAALQTMQSAASQLPATDSTTPATSLPHKATSIILQSLNLKLPESTDDDNQRFAELQGVISGEARYIRDDQNKDDIIKLHGRERIDEPESPHMKQLSEIYHNALERPVTTHNYILYKEITDLLAKESILTAKCPFMTWMNPITKRSTGYMFINEHPPSQTTKGQLQSLLSKKKAELNLYKKKLASKTILDFIGKMANANEIKPFIQGMSPNNQEKLRTAIQCDIKTIASSDNALHDTAMALRILNALPNNNHACQQVAANIPYDALIKNATGADLAYLTEIIEFARTNTPKNSQIALAQKLSTTFTENYLTTNSQILPEVGTQKEAENAFKQYQALTKFVRTYCPDTKLPNPERNEGKIALLTQRITHEYKKPASEPKPWVEFYQTQFKDGVKTIPLEQLKELSSKQMDALLRANSTMVTSSQRFSPLCTNYNQKVADLITQLPQLSLEAMSRLDVKKLTPENQWLLMQKFALCDWTQLAKDFCVRQGVAGPTEALNSPSDVNQFLTKSTLTIPLQVLRFLSESKDALKKHLDSAEAKAEAASAEQAHTAPTHKDNVENMDNMANYAKEFASMTSDAVYQKGLTMHKSAQKSNDEELHKKAVEHLTNAANREHSQARRCLGILYKFGIGVGQDKEQAISWLTKASELGNIEAQLSLCQLYYTNDDSYTGSNNTKDTGTKPVEFYEKEANLGDVRAIFLAGITYLYGNNVTIRDVFKAKDCFTKIPKDTTHIDPEAVQFYQVLCESEINNWQYE